VTPADLDVPIRAGLDKVDALKPGAGFAEVLAGARGGSSGLEGFARAEAGWHFMPQGSAFGFGEASISPTTGAAWQAGVGARFTW
jgi:hypothetical protein